MFKFPELKPDATATDALRLMRASGRSAGVVQIGNGLWFITARDIAQARSAHLAADPAWHDPTIGEVCTRHQPLDHVLHGAGPLGELLSGISIHGLMLNIYNSSSGGNVDIPTNVVSRFHNANLVVVLCTCSVDHTHIWLPDELDNNNCPKDGKSVNCQ
jgi:hypothetical protein